MADTLKRSEHIRQVKAKIQNSKSQIPASDRIRTAVIGAGKMGAIHAKVYDGLARSELVAVVDIVEDKARHLAKQYKCMAATSCADILDKVDAVTIATPTVTHLEIAEIFIKNGIAVMVEKPLAADVAEGRRIVNLAKKNNCVVAVGHSERCNPVVQAMKRLDIEPRFIEATRISPYPFRSTDVGVVLDVMIHDIDIILSLAASEVKKVDAVGVSVVEDKEDICNARVVFENGCIANITASRLALKTERKVRVFSRQAYLSVDYLKKSGTIIKANPNVDVVEKIRALKRGGKFNILKVNWPDLLHVEKLKIDDKEPLRLEQESFLRAAADKKLRPEVSAEEGLAALQCAEKILASVKKHKWNEEIAYST
jgi:predicted dehydrogenase